MHPDQPAVILRAARLRLAAARNVSNPAGWLATVRAQIIADHADRIDDLLASGATVAEVAAVIADTDLSGDARSVTLSPVDLARSHSIAEQRSTLGPVPQTPTMTRAESLAAVRQIRSTLHATSGG